MPKWREGHPVVEAALWLALVFLIVAGAVTGISRTNTVRGPFDPVLHAGGSVLLTVFFLMAAVWRPGRGDGWFPHGSLTVAAIVLAVGVGIEVAQSSWDIEVGSLGDIATDAAGIAVGWFAWWALKRWLTRTKESTSDSLGP